MLNGIWMAMIVLAFVGAVCTGRWTALSAAAAVTLRASYGSADPYDVLPHIWLVSFGSLLVCVLMCRVFQKLWRA